MSRRRDRTGFARVPNYITDAIARADLSGRELRVWLALVQRRILGWRERRKTCRVQVSRAELAEATGLDPAHVTRALRSLEARGIIRCVSVAQNRTPAEYFFEPRPGCWNGVTTGEDEEARGAKTAPPDRCQNGTGAKTAPLEVPKRHLQTTSARHNHAARRAPKETLKKGTSLAVRSEPGSPCRGYQSEEEFEAELAELARQDPGLFTPAYLEIQREYRARDLAALGRRP